MHLEVNAALKFAKEFDDIIDDEYADLNKTIKKKIENMKHSNISVMVHKHNAVFGSGKSDYIKANADRKHDLIVVPTKQLKQMYIKPGVS